MRRQKSQNTEGRGKGRKISALKTFWKQVWELTKVCEMGKQLKKNMWERWVLFCWFVGGVGGIFLFSLLYPTSVLHHESCHAEGTLWGDRKLFPFTATSRDLDVTSQAHILHG